MKFFVALLVIQTTVNAFFSVNYASDESHSALMTLPNVFLTVPNAEHVADIYVRLCGLPPLLVEERESMPALDIFTQQVQQPILLELSGGRLPQSVKSVVKATAFNRGVVGPSMQSVIEVLTHHGIQVESKKMQANDEMPNEISDWIKSQSRPVVILHHETPTAVHYIQRDLANSTVTPLTEFQISQYQICLWTGVSMVLLILSSVCCIIQMEVIPDSLLYAKFQSARTHKND